MSTALIACDHGLGHIRRMVLISGELRRRGETTTVFAPAAKVARVISALSAPGQRPTGRSLQVVDFATHTTPAALRADDPRTTQWHRRLPDMSGYDRVVCDTLPEVLEIRPDALLVAQFFWHDVVTNVAPDYRRRARSLLTRNPIVVGSRAFAMPGVTRQTGFIPVGLFGSPTSRQQEAAGNALLISGGSTAAADNEMSNVLTALAALSHLPYAPILVDPRLVGSASAVNVQVADFSPAMFAQTVLAIGRPGLGLVTELLSRSTPLICLVEAGNAEIAHNSAVLSDAGMGTIAHSSAEVLAAVEHWSPKPEALANFREIFHFNGVQQFCDVLMQCASVPR